MLAIPSDVSAGAALTLVLPLLTLVIVLGWAWTRRARVM